MIKRKIFKRDDTLLKAKNRLEDSNLEIRLKLIQRDVERQKTRLERQIDQILDFQQQCKKSSGDSIEIYRELMLRSQLGSFLPPIDPQTKIYNFNNISSHSNQSSINYSSQNLMNICPAYVKGPKLTANLLKLNEIHQKNLVSRYNSVTEQTKRPIHLEPIDSGINRPVKLTDEKEILTKSVNSIVSSMKSIKKIANDLHSRTSFDNSTVNINNQSDRNKILPNPLTSNLNFYSSKDFTWKENPLLISDKQTSRIHFKLKTKGKNNEPKNLTNETITNSFEPPKTSRICLDSINPLLEDCKENKNIDVYKNMINMQRSIKQFQQMPSKNIESSQHGKSIDSVNVESIIARISSDLNIPYPLVPGDSTDEITVKINCNKQQKEDEQDQQQQQQCSLCNYKLLDPNYQNNRLKQKGMFLPERVSNSDISDDSCCQSPASEDKNYVMYKGQKLKNYVKPEERFKMEQVSKIRRKKHLLLKLLRNRPSYYETKSLDQNIIKMTGNNVPFTEPAQEKALQRLVDKNIANPVIYRPEIDHSELDNKVHQFMEVLDSHTDHCLI
ncbi:hypothetical protein Ahia01_001024700 [Argonauta hians]